MRSQALPFLTALVVGFAGAPSVAQTPTPTATPTSTPAPYCSDCALDIDGDGDVDPDDLTLCFGCAVPLWCGIPACEGWDLDADGVVTFIDFSLFLSCPVVPLICAVEDIPSAFSITTDGLFTDPDEWSDVTPLTGFGGASFVYTSADPGLEALYLMYDFPMNRTALALGELAGPVHFHNAGSTFEVFFTCPASILVLKDGAVLDVSDPAGGEDSFQGACGFGPSPNAASPHNMFELEVLFDGSDPTLAGHNHGQYSPDPSHWGASLPRDTPPDPVCSLPNDPQCDPDNIPTGGGDPTIVPCPAPLDLEQLPPGVRVSFSPASSNACVEVKRGQAGNIRIRRIPLPEPGALLSLGPGLMLLGWLDRRRRRRAIGRRATSPR